MSLYLVHLCCATYLDQIITYIWTKYLFIKFDRFVFLPEPPFYSAGTFFGATPFLNTLCLRTIARTEELIFMIHVAFLVCFFSRSKVFGFVLDRWRHQQKSKQNKQEDEPKQTQQRTESRLCFLTERQHWKHSNLNQHVTKNTPELLGDNIFVHEQKPKQQTQPNPENQNKWNKTNQTDVEKCLPMAADSCNQVS